MGLNISDFFYASTDPDNGNKVNISSLLAGEDGSYCTITLADKAGETSSTQSVAFTDMQDMKRLGSFWAIGDEGAYFLFKETILTIHKIQSFVLILQVVIVFRLQYTKPQQC